MINFTNKFDNKCENLGFFIPEDKFSLKTSKIDEGKKDKINKFLKRIEKNKDKKKLHSFDISDTQRCFVIILGEKLINFELNNLGGSFKNLIGSHKNLKSKLTTLFFDPKYIPGPFPIFDFFKLFLKIPNNTNKNTTKYKKN